jgi:BMFP domain-containing protein YqiC
MHEKHLQHPATDAQIAEQKRNEQTALLARVAELEARVTALEGRQ